MTSVPVEPTTALTAPLTRPSAAFPSDAAQASAITTDFLALVGFAARLGTCVNNDATDTDGQDAKSVRDEAMLLMSLLMGKKAEEILSEEIGAKESRCEKRKNRSRPKDRDMGNFSFTFPSLSLQPYAAPGPEGAAAADAEAKTTSAVPNEGAQGEAEDDKGDADLPPPSQLMRRQQSVTDKDAIRDSSESMAHNVLESFGAALVWRAKTWIKSLANVLALKEQERIEALKNAPGKGEDGVITEAGQEVEGGQEGQEGANESSQEEGQTIENNDLMNSREMQIIDAIVKSSEEVSVVNIKTAFRVLPNRVSQQQSTNASQKQSSQGEPAYKKAKTESPQGKGKEYKVTHKLMFEATISMTSNDGVRYNGVKLQAPGYIQGTFTNKKAKPTGAEGEETLTGVSMTLDTNALALSLERQSRLVVRRAAEAALMAASGIEASSSPHYMESPHVHHSIISPRYVLMSPVPAYPQADSSNAPLLPSVPSANVLNGERVSGKDASTMVSSSEGHSSDSSAATTPSLTPMKKPKAGAQSPSFPALLSVANEELSRGD
mmetsp:Transcript_4345/g.9619  ORF Transcript_4345/g.9619 Transcript_4345/m.9619 type:complete len:550 (+) Transcript_4345:68-1717(+)